MAKHSNRPHPRDILAELALALGQANDIGADAAPEGA